MVVEVDQSGRVEDLATGTAVAFANDYSGVIFVAAGEKRKIVNFLKKNKKYNSEFAVIFFSTLLFCLLQKEKLNRIFIDEEYTGKEKLIETTIMALFRKYKKESPQVKFTNIGKLSPAHRLAWLAHKKKGRDCQKVHFEDIFKILK